MTALMSLYCTVLCASLTIENKRRLQDSKDKSAHSADERWTWGDKGHVPSRLSHHHYSKMGAGDAVSTAQEEADGKEFLGCCPGQVSPVWYLAKRDMGHPSCQGTPGSLLPFLHLLHLLCIHQHPTCGWCGCRAGPGGGSGAAQRGQRSGVWHPHPPHARPGLRHSWC